MINDNNFLFVCIIPSLFEKASANVYLSNSLQKLFTLKSFPYGQRN